MTDFFRIPGWVGISVLGWGLLAGVSAEEVSPQVLERIAFGSCASQNKPQPVWDEVVKVESQQIMLDFYGVPADSPRRKRAGVYESWRFGPEGKRVQIILLDLRYFRSRASKDTRSAEEKARLNLVGWYVPNQDPAATVLGADQWTWLETQLRLPADLRVIGSSTQVIASEKGMESWGNFPLERKRLYDLIGRTGANGVVFISGDVHFSEISRTNEGPYPLFDFTSSGLTNSHPGWAAAVNPHRVSPVAYAEPNFGLLQIDWNAPAPAVTMETRTLNGSVEISQKILLSDLKKK